MSEAQVRLRPVTEADLPDYVEWLNDPEVTQFTQIESGGITLEGEREWFQRVTGPDSRTRNWGIEAAGRHLGNCALMPDESGEMAGFGIIIGDKRQWGKGYGAAALREVLRIGFEEMGLQRIHLTALAPNARGIRCYEKCGFRHEGVRRRHFLKRGHWHDVVCMGILREEWEARRGCVATGLCPLGPEHVDEVLALWSGTDLWPHTCEDRAFIAGGLAANREFALGWRVSGELVGTAIGAFDGFRGWIYRVAVRPDHRRRGIASTLVGEVEKRLAAAGVRQINLMVYKPSAQAHLLYAKLAYEPSEVDVLRKRFAAREEAGNGR